VHESYLDHKTVWFQGHWGFQYYMEEIGGKPVDFQHFQPAKGDIVVIPESNTNVMTLPAAWPVERVIEVPSARLISTMNYQLGAGFYADVFGLLPFVISPVGPERFTIVEVK
jgi:hypothetical protein